MEHMETDLGQVLRRTTDGWRREDERSERRSEARFRSDEVGETENGEWQWCSLQATWFCLG